VATLTQALKKIQKETELSNSTKNFVALSITIYEKYFLILSNEKTP